ncbi:MAG: hypothetical protein EBS98_09915, partial [Chitinophagia bacterium]|nr:hypothetical protein [Chitinophagia bacterium]
MELVCDPITGTMYGPESPIPIPPSAIPINCGQWKPINERTSLCNEICYNIYEYIAGLCGWTLNDLQTISPSKLDQNCCPIYYHPTLVPNNFRGNDQNKKYLLPQLDISQKINDPIYNITLSNTLLPKDFPGQFNASPVDFVTLKNLNYNNPNSPTLIAGNEATIVEQLLKSGSYPPYSGVEYYTNVNDCRDCYGALYKLGTPDPYGRQSTVEMSGTLLNANSGDQLVYTDILLQTSETLPISECIKAKYDGDPDPIAPYGILTNELSSSQSMVNSNANYYLRFDISYLYEITWDNTEDPEATWIPFTNKWRVSNVGYWAISGYSGNITRYDYHSIPDLISVTDSGLAFNPINTGVQIKSEWRNWYGSGVLIGNNDCDFEDQPLPLNKYGSQFRSEPTLTISSTGTGSGCSFIPTLQSKNEPNGLPYWNISGVTINGSGSGYTNNETLKINIAKGDVEEIPATLKLLTTLSQIVQPQISGTISANSLVPATLSVSTEIYQNDPNPKRWRVNSISVTDKGSGYDDGIYNIDFEPYNNSIEIASATGIAVTERIAPEFTATLVTASGAGANPSWGLSLERNSNGQKTWVFNGVFCTPEEEGGAPVFECGTNYTNDDYIELVFESGAIKDTFYDPYDPNNRVQEIEPRKYRIYLETFEGTVLNDNIPQAPAHYKSTGKIEIAIVTSSLLTGQSSYFAYPNDDPELFGGSYYKEIVGGIPTGVLIENSGKYYHSNSSTIRAISGPCITNIEADIWHPGPCGINSILETETSMNTPWENTSGSDGRINGTTFSSQSANFTTDLVNQYLLISNGLKYLKYKVIEYLTNKSLKIESILGGDALINQNQDRQYYVGGIGFNNLIYNLYKKSWILYNG